MVFRSVCVSTKKLEEKRSSEASQILWLERSYVTFKRKQSPSSALSITAFPKKASRKKESEHLNQEKTG